MISPASARAYARLLEKQIRARTPVKPLCFRLCNFRRRPQLEINFTGDPHLITRAQIEQAVLSSQDRIELKVSPPADFPREVLELKAFYEAERNRIVSQEMGKSPADRFHPDAVGNELKALSLEMMRRATEIAQSRTAERFGRKETKFSVLVMAGSARGPELDSDLDYTIVYQGEKRVYFDYLAEQLKGILFQCGADGDNLIERFSEKGLRTLKVDDLDSYYLIFRLAAGSIPAVGFDDPDILESFHSNAARICDQQDKLFKDSSWLDIFYAVGIREKTTSWGFINPALMSRKINVALSILAICRGLPSDQWPNAGEILVQTEILGTKQFFGRIKNALWYLYRGATPCLTRNDLSMAAKLLGYADGEGLGVEIIRKKALVDDFFADAVSQGKFNRTRQRIYNFGRRVKVYAEKTWDFVRDSGREVVFVSRRPSTVTT